MHVSGEINSRLEIVSNTTSKNDLETSNEYDKMPHLVDSDEEEESSSSDENETETKDEVSDNDLNYNCINKSK